MKVPVSLLWPTQILDSTIKTLSSNWLLAINIKSNLTSFSPVCVSTWFCLVFLLADFSVLSQILTLISAHLFYCTFSTFKTYCVAFSIQTLWCFLWSTRIFFFLTLPFLLYLHQILHTANWKQPTTSTTLYCRLSTWMSFTILSIVSINRSFIGIYVSFQLDMPNHLLKLSRTVF